MAEKRIRNLNPEEIECRVGMIMEQGITLLLYKNARVDQTIPYWMKCLESADGREGII